MPGRGWIEMRRVALDALVVAVGVGLVLAGAWFDASRGASCHHPVLSRVVGVGLVLAAGLLWEASGLLGAAARGLLVVGVSHAAASPSAVEFSLLAAPLVVAGLFLAGRRLGASGSGLLVEGVGCEACEGSCKGARG